jgi:hypothetical protein
MSRLASMIAFSCLCAFLPVRVAIAQAVDAQADLTASCRRAVAGFMAALEAGDAEGLRLYIQTDRRVGAQQLGLGALIDCIVSQRELERAMAKKWGESVAIRIAGPVLFSPEDRAAVARAEVQSQGDNEALLMFSSSVAPVALHRNYRDQRWRVRIAMISGLYDGFEHSPSPASYKRITYLRTVAGALQFATRQVDEGKLTSPNATRAAIQRIIETAIQSSPGKRGGHNRDRD